LNRAQAFIALLLVLCFVGCEQGDYSQERVLAESASLRGQNMSLISRGQNFAYYTVDAYSDRGDTLRCQYRVPAGVKNRKLKALIYVNSSAEDFNLKRLDGFGPAGVTAVLNLNLHGLFERDDRGAIKPSKKAVFDGVLRSRRSMDMLVQLLRKHQAVSPEQIFVAGDGEGAALLLSALVGRSNALAGVALTNFGDGIIATKNLQKLDFVNAEEWAKQLRGRVAVAPPLPQGVSFAGKLQTLEGPSIESVLRWVAGGDTLALPDQSDTTFTRVMKVES